MPWERPALYQVGATTADQNTGVNLMESGLFAGATPVDAPLWYGGRNVVFRDGGPQKLGGWVSPIAISTSGIIRGMDALQDEAAVQRLFAGDQTKLYMWNGSTVAILGTGYTGSVDETSVAPATTWSFTRFGNWMLATNGVDPAQVWKATGTFSNLANTTFTRAEILLRFKRQILALNTSNGGAWVEWCDNDNPEIWGVLTTNAAGNLNLRDMDGAIIAAAVFNQDQIAVLAKNQLFMLTWQGAPFYYGFALALTGIGAVSKTCIVVVGAYLFGLSSTGFWQSDTRTFKFIDTPSVRDFFNAIVDRDNLTKVAVTYDAANQQVIWSVPLAGGSGENELNFAYRVQNGSWSLHDATVARTAWVPQNGVFLQPYGVGATSGGAAPFYQHNTGLSADGDDMATYVQTKPLDCGKPALRKHLQNVLVAARRVAGSPVIQIGTQADMNSAIAWSSSLTLDQAYARLSCRVSGRFLSLRISSAGDADDYAVTGFGLMGRYGGVV